MSLENFSPFSEHLLSDVWVSLFSCHTHWSEKLRLELLRARDDEQRQIARDLQEVIAQFLLMLEIDLKAMREGEGLAKQTAHESAMEVVATLQKQVRSFSYLLHPPEPERLGLPLALNALATGMAARTGIDISFVSDGYEGTSFGGAELTIFRVAQAALMDIFKRSRAHCADLRLTSRRHWTILRVREKRCGVLPCAPEQGRRLDNGVSLAGIRGRLEGLPGRFSVRQKAQGTVLTAIVRGVEPAR